LGTAWRNTGRQGSMKAGKGPGFALGSMRAMKRAGERWVAVRGLAGMLSAYEATDVRSAGNQQICLASQLFARRSTNSVWRSVADHVGRALLAFRSLGHAYKPSISFTSS
jgi:hypothetical protein